MGNCALRGGLGESDDRQMVKVVTHGGGVMELYPPMTAECITNGFPGYGLYTAPCGDRFSKPLVHSEDLRGGEVYHLRPLNEYPQLRAPSVAAPYRMSFDHQYGFWKRQEADHLFPRCGYNAGGGADIWRVKLVITPAQLAEILSQEARTEELIESVRTVAKCRNGSALASSDQWSLASSRKGSSESVG